MGSKQKGEGGLGDRKCVVLENYLFEDRVHSRHQEAGRVAAMGWVRIRRRLMKCKGYTRAAKTMTPF